MPSERSGVTVQEEKEDAELLAVSPRGHAVMVIGRINRGSGASLPAASIVKMSSHR